MLTLANLQKKISQQKTFIEDSVKSGRTTQEQVDHAFRKMDMDTEEHAKLQELKSLAFAQGRFDLQSSQAIYEMLGETVEHFNAQPIEVKVIMNKLLSELLEGK